MSKRNRRIRRLHVIDDDGQDVIKNLKELAKSRVTDPDLLTELVTGLNFVENMIIEAVRMAGGSDPLEPEEAPPTICARCAHILTRTPEQLEEAIQLMADRAAGSGWDRERFVEKMREGLGVDDEVLWIGVGAVNVRKVNGELMSIYQRDS